MSLLAASLISPLLIRPVSLSVLADFELCHIFIYTFILRKVFIVYIYIVHSVSCAAGNVNFLEGVIPKGSIKSSLS